MTALFQAAQQHWRNLPPVPRLIVSTVLIIILMTLLKPNANKETDLKPGDRVATETAQLGSFAPELRLFGRIESPASATLSSSVTAQVDSTPFLPGAHVNQGDLILVLDPREAQLAQQQASAALEQAQAQLASAKRSHKSDINALKLEQELLQLSKENLARLERLQSDNLVSQAQLDSARQELARQQLSMENRQLAVSNYENTRNRLNADIDRAKAARDQAELDLSRSQVIAPFDGRITTLHVAPGERVRPGEPLISLYGDRGVEIRAQIPLRHLPQVRAGLENGPLPGWMVLEGVEVPLQLMRLAGTVQAGQGGVDGLFLLQEDSLIPELGRPLELMLTLPEKPNLIAVPATALHGLNRLYRIDEENKLDAITVERAGEWTDADGLRRILVSADVSAGEQLMVNQLPGAIDGLLVVPKLKGNTPLTAQAQARLDIDKEAADTTTEPTTGTDTERTDSNKDSTEENPETKTEVKAEKTETPPGNKPNTADSEVDTEEDAEVVAGDDAE